MLRALSRTGRVTYVLRSDSNPGLTQRHEKTLRTLEA